MSRKRPTVADLRAQKGKKQLPMLRLFTVEEAAVAELAGIDIVSIPPELLLDPRYREVAPWWCQTNSNSSLQGHRGCPLCRAESAPFSKSGVAIELEIVSAVEGAFLIEMIADGGMNGNEFL